MNRFRLKYDAQFKNEAFDTQEKAEGTGIPGHDWGEWVVTKEPTETAEGERQRVCKKDPSHIETEVIPAMSTGEYSLLSGGECKGSTFGGVCIRRRRCTGRAA